MYNTAFITLLDKRIGALEHELQEVKALLTPAVGDNTRNVIELAQHGSDIGDAVCELSEDIDARVSDLENAICELSEQ